MDFIMSNLIIIEIALLLYPIGIAYGWDKMKNTWFRIRNKDRMGQLENTGYNTIMYTALNISFAVFFTFCIGWILGVIKAVIMLKNIKKQI